MNEIISEIIDKAVSRIGVALSLGATMVVGLTINDIAVIIGMIGTFVLAILNIYKHKMEEKRHQLTIEKARDDAKEHDLAVKKLNLEIKILSDRIATHEKNANDITDNDSINNA